MPDAIGNADWEANAMAFLSTPRCGLDAFSQVFQEEFGTVVALASERCQQILHMLLRELELSTYSTERLHSSNSRRARARYATHSLTVPQMAVAQSEGIPQCCRPFAKLQASTDVSASKGQKRKRLEAGATDRKKRGGGGAWRAWLHVHGQGTGKIDWHQQSLDYQACGDEEWNRMQEIGKQATILNRTGRAFPQPSRLHSRTSSRQHLRILWR